MRNEKKKKKYASFQCVDNTQKRIFLFLFVILTFRYTHIRFIVAAKCYQLHI